MVEAYGRWQLQFRKFPKRPKTFHDLFQATLTSGKIVDPASLGLQKLTESEFLISLANALDAAIIRGNGHCEAHRMGEGGPIYFLIACITYQSLNAAKKWTNLMSLAKEFHRR